MVQKAKPISWTQLKSSNLYLSRHDENGLHVMFHKPKGVTYTYPNITKEQYAKMLEAESVGKYFHKNIMSSDFTKDTVEMETLTIEEKKP